MGSEFRIRGMRHCFLTAIKDRLGVRNYRIVGAALVLLLIGTITTTVLLSMNQDESFASGADLEGVVDIRFLNTQTGSGLVGAYTDKNGTYTGQAGGGYYKGNEANLIKTKDGKYVLLDTGHEDQEIRKRIKTALDPSNPTIDYLIVSHLDKDHFGNAAKLINNDTIKVKNVVVKYEGGYIKKNDTKKQAYDTIVSAAKKEGANLYTNAGGHKVDGVAVEDYSKYKKMTTEGIGNARIEVGSYLVLYFYNTKDVYKDEDCSQSGYYTRFSFLPVSGDLNDFLIKDSNKKYQVYNNSNGVYPSVSFTKTTSLSDGTKGSFNNTYYRAFATGDDGKIKTGPVCRSNSNSYGVLAEAKTNAGSKYAYFPNDIDNYGYDIGATSTKVTYYSATAGADVTKANYGVYGNGAGVLFQSSSSSSVLNNKRVAESSKVYSESKVALEIADMLGSNKSNIVIYQVGHHGGNNAPDAIDTLGVNRSDMYAINNRGTSIKNSGTFQFARTYYYALGKVKNKMYSGYNMGNGVFCKIASDGSTKCSYNEIKINTLSYNMNGGAGSIEAQKCMGDSACSIRITSAQPTRANYKFLGWAKTASGQAVYSASSNLEISSDTTLYAIWAPAYTLSFNTNGGSGSIADLSCSAITAGGTCTIKINVSNPTRSGYEFLGWSESSSATSASYTNGSSITMNSSKILYAVWRRVINITTSVNGTGGTISPSMTGIPKGRTVVITFSPSTNYEIDNVTVNGTISNDVSDNKLSLTAGDEDLNVVVTFKSTETTPVEPPSFQTFTMTFSSNNGGTNFPSAVSCTTTEATPDKCSVTVPSQQPTRDGYVFLGYGLSSNKNTVVYLPDETYELTQSVYVIGVWAPIYTLSYDMNGGTGTIADQSCNPTISPLDECSVVISSEKPTKEGHEFFGWSTNANASLPEYASGEEFSFAYGIRQVKLYAVWIEEEIDVEWVQGQDYKKGSNTDLIVRIDYPMARFRSLYIDDAEVDSSVYSVGNGSTIITLSGEYVDGLAEGAHTLQAQYLDNVVLDTGFMVSDRIIDDPTVDPHDDESYDDFAGVTENDENEALDGDLLVPNTGSAIDEEGGNNTVLLMMIPIVLSVAYLKYGKKFFRKNQVRFKKH